MTGCSKRERWKVDHGTFALAQVEVFPVTPLRLLASKPWLAALGLLLVTPRNITCGWYITKTNSSGVDIQLASSLLFPTLLYNQDSPKRPNMRWSCRSCRNTYGWALHECEGEEQFGVIRIPRFDEG
jgi:hypothetical protein